MTEFAYESQIKLDNSNTIINKTEKKELHKAILDAIIIDSRPFGDFRKDGMARLLHKVAKGFKPRDRHTNSKYFKKEYTVYF